ncbi:hypothetical protein [Enterococcus larvae]|uniref:hypothetical protein n=1 Tax=Enterococcus larvae TaxID=2794352 RepID=UPI003F325C02
MDLTIWEILNIEPTTDIREIKQAYAAKLKALNIDQQMEEFQELKAAFDLALIHARSGANEEEPAAVRFTTEIEQPIIFEQDDEVEQAFFDWGELRIFSVDLQKLKQEQNYFNDLSMWEELTDQIFDWSTDEYWENQYLVQLFLLNNFRWLSKEVIHYLVAVFDLEDLNEQIIQSQYISDDFKYHLATIKNVPVFSFDVWHDIPQQWRERYFATRYEAYRLLTSSHIYAEDPFSQRIDDCLALIQHDPEIYALQLMKLLIDKNGVELTDAEKQYFSDSLNKGTASGAENQTLLFLLDYYTLVIEKKEQAPSQKIEWETDLLLVPKPLIHILYESMLFQQKEYTAAFTTWKKLSRDQRLPRLKKYNQVKQHLPQKEQNELVQLNKHLHKQTEQYKKKKATQSSFIRGVFAVAVIILIICGVLGTSRNSSKPVSKVDMELIKKIQDENKTANNQLIQSVLALQKKNEQARTFTNALYSDEEVNVEGLFATEELRAELEAKKATVQLDDYERDEFSYYSRLDGQEMLRYISVYHKDEFLYLITVDAANDTITAVYGADWTQVPEKELEGMVNFSRVKKQEIAFLFIKEFLFAENRAETLENYGVYFSPTLRMTMEKNLQLPIPENFRNGWLYQVGMDYNEIVYALTNEQDELLYFAFDEEDRLHQIYGENWDSEEIPSLDAIGEHALVIDILNSY